MPKIDYPSSSAYSQTYQYSWAIGRYADRVIPDDGTDEMFTITAEYHYRADKLAYDKYGDPNYFWVFMSRNPSITDPIWGFAVGLTIRIPTLANVKKAKVKTN